jgi:hypothetical protein
MKYKKNNKSEATKLKEVLKEVRQLYLYWQHKTCMDVMNANRNKEDYQSREIKFRKIYKIIKEKGIDSLPKKEDREYWTNKFQEKGYTRID